MSKIVNLKIEENATFTKVLKFTKKVKRGETVNDITGETVAKYVKEPIPLTNYTIAAQLKVSLEDDAAIVAVFETQILDSSKGLASIALPKEITAALDKYAPIHPTGSRADRVSVIGFYDVLLTNEEGVATRIFQGKCYFSRAATKDPLISISSKNTIVTKSEITPINSRVDINVDKTKAHYYAGIQYFQGGVQITPTAGQVEVYRMPDAANEFQHTPVGILLATAPASEIAWHANTRKVRVVPSNVAGATAYQLVVVSNVS